MALKRYAEFEGRSRRKEYWYFVLFNIIFSLFAFWLDTALGLFNEEYFTGPIQSLYALAVFIPGLAVAVRRLHDVGKSGWFLLISLIPLIGAIWLLVLFATESDNGENKYGSDPRRESVSI